MGGMLTHASTHAHVMSCDDINDVIWRQLVGLYVLKFHNLITWLLVKQV